LARKHEMYYFLKKKISGHTMLNYCTTNYTL